MYVLHTPIFDKGQSSQANVQATHALFATLVCYSIQLACASSQAAPNNLLVSPLACSKERKVTLGYER